MSITSENIKIDNTCPRIRLWNQYKKNAAVVNYFDWLQTYYQAKFFDYLETTAMPALSISGATGDYLFFYGTNILGIGYKPINITSETLYDSGFNYDAGNLYDIIVGYLVTWGQLQTIMKWIFDWSQNNWTIPALYNLISKFTGLAYSDIAIVQDNNNLDLFTITMPTTTLSSLFRNMVLYYSRLMGLTFGYYFAITLT